MAEDDTGGRRRQKRRPADRERTPHTSPLPLTSGGEKLPDRADVVLIAHPAHKLLGTRYQLLRGKSLEIGRSSASDISLPDVPSVSRHHAVLVFENQVTLEDLGSTNGTLLEEEAIDGPRLVHSGQRFQVGAVHFKLLHEHDVEQAYERAMQDLATRDGLTQLYNRRKLEEDAERECLRAGRYGRLLSLVLFDVDHFKSVNDTYGHLRGDSVLQKIASRARDLTRSEQIVARVGGEEFAVLCPEVDATGAAALAERLRAAFSDVEHHDEEQRFHVTCSFGVAAWQPGYTAFTDLFDAADRALYAAKQAGRDRVTLA